MHLLQKKLNGLLSKNSLTQDALANDNFNIETELVERLKQRKKEAIELEEKIYVWAPPSHTYPPPQNFASVSVLNNMSV